MVEERMPLYLSARVLIGGLAIVVAIAMLALVAGLRNAHRAEEAARARFADAQALAALPPASTDSIQEDLASVNSQLATAQAARDAGVDGHVGRRHHHHAHSDRAGCRDSA